MATKPGKQFVLRAGINVITGSGLAPGDSPLYGRYLAGETGIYHLGWCRGDNEHVAILLLQKLRRRHLIQE
ncbi:MAG TPA: hypothetical protein DG761_06625, partial [Gammaproteobacteria bacterium]|nr:hypothetical protein [Gammaproteobacteria bacterium]